jgi:NADPH:quinone reductase-like Zn-dependent oxidoreductase
MTVMSGLVHWTLVSPWPSSHGDTFVRWIGVAASGLMRGMHAIRVHRFGGLESLVNEEVPTPSPGPGEVLLRVHAAGVGPWDAWIRSGRSVVSQPLPLTLGSDVAGIVESVGPEVAQFQPGDAVFGATNERFTGGYAELAVASASKLARKPPQVNFIEAASIPVVACTAWQMVFEHGSIDATKRVVVHGAAGNVGAYAVQLAKRVAGEVVATTSSKDVAYVQTLNPDRVVDVQTSRFEDLVGKVDVVLDTVGGDTQDRSFSVLTPGGVLVSAVSEPDQSKAASHGVRAFFFLVEVSSSRLERLTAWVEAGMLRTNVGDVLPLREARLAHEMLAGKPHKRGKIVLAVAPLSRR